MSVVVVSLVVLILIVGVVVALANSEVEHRLKLGTQFLEALTRLKEINERLAGLENQLSRIPTAVSPSSAGSWDARHTTVKQVFGSTNARKKDLYDRAMGMDIDRALDQFESEQSL